jgi:hypothetical protein
MTSSDKRTVGRTTGRRRARTDEDRRLGRAIDARRSLTDHRAGRAWINGREVGGEDPRYAHLSESHD